MPENPIKTLLLIVHVLSASAWFGAMIYSLFVLQPRAKVYFNSLTDFEAFVTFIAAGARWKVLSGMLLVASTGLLLWQGKDSPDQAWTTAMYLKSGLFIMALLIFCYASWKLWPARVFATAKDLPRIQLIFKLLGYTLIGLCGLAFIISFWVR